MSLASYREDYIGDSLNDSSTFNKLSADLYPKQKFELLKALDWIETTLSNNWSGYNSVKPNSQAIAMARHFIESLPFNKMHASNLSPDGDGGICLKWKINEKTLILTLDGIFLHMSYDDRNNEPIFINDRSYFDASFAIPQEILQYIENDPRRSTVTRN